MTNRAKCTHEPAGLVPLLPSLQKQRGQRRQGEPQRERASVGRLCVGGYAAEITHAGAVVFQCVTIEQFAPEAAAQMKACEETSRKM
jgi:hypothetical protein